jgi:predicted nucleic acid-binding protein
MRAGKAPLNIVDSSAWLEYFADGPNATDFAPAIETVDALVVPTIVVYEVFRRVLVQRSEAAALDLAAVLRQGKLVELSASLATRSAQLGVAHRLPLADSIVYATAEQFGGIVWTQDADFELLPRVEYRPHGGKRA